jgi:hypothetical protein
VAPEDSGGSDDGQGSGTPPLDDDIPF